MSWQTAALMQAHAQTQARIAQIQGKSNLTVKCLLFSLSPLARRQVISWGLVSRTGLIWVLRQCGQNIMRQLWQMVTGIATLGTHAWHCRAPEPTLRLQRCQCAALRPQHALISAHLAQMAGKQSESCAIASGQVLPAW